MTNLGTGDRFLIVFLLSLVNYKVMPFAIFLISLAALFIAWIYYEYDRKKYWHRIGVPGPIGNPIFGTMIQIIRNGVIGFDKENFEKYGKFYGTFMMDRPNLTTIDMDVIRRVAIKNFPHFQNRIEIVDTKQADLSSDSLFRNAMTIIRGDTWKRVRNRVTPAFTSGKMKRLLPTLEECTNRLCEHIQEEYIGNGKEIPLKDLFGQLVLEEIARGGFSLDVDIISGKGQNDIFVQKTKEAFGTKTVQYLFFFLAFCPALTSMLEKYFHLDLFKNPAEPYFKELLEGMYDQRKADPAATEVILRKFNDIFQILLNAVNDEGEGGSNGQQKEPLENAMEEDGDIIHKELTQSAKTIGKHLRKIELLSQSFIFLIAGYETTGSALHYAIWLLALFPEYQQRLREEIGEVIGDQQESITFDQLRRMHFLRATLQETLRFYPIAPLIQRECTEDIQINGIPLFRGNLVTIPVYHIHHSEEFYPDPEKFDPERFLPDRKAEMDPATFLTFGIGPRNCIGMRFAEFQMHIALAILIRRFRFFPGPKTPKFPVKVLSMDMLRPAEPLVVMAEPILEEEEK